MGANMILTIGAILLFGMFLRSSNTLMMDNTQLASRIEYNITALSLGQSIIDEAKAKAFDERTAGLSFSLASPNLCTRWDSLGIDPPSFSAEGVPNPDTAISSGYRSILKFDDIDDYNGYIRLVNTPRAEGYWIAVVVTYADTINPDITYANSRSWCKRMSVTVWNKFMSDTVKLTYAFTY